MWCAGAPTIDQRELLKHGERCPYDASELADAGGADAKGGALEPDHVAGRTDDRTHLRDAGFDVQHATALCATDPPLALTHMPLRRVPPTAVNVHGHLHKTDGTSRKHVNVSVERTDYAPVGLSWILEVCRRQTTA